ncbi:MAG: DUF4381 domain-containing protein [Gammaproteobacteria bacterium]
MPSPAAQTSLELRDIHLPAEPAFWPPAPGWWLLAVLTLLLLIWLGRKLSRYLSMKKHCQQIFSLLDNLQKQNQDQKNQLMQLSIFMRQLALMRYPRENVAALTGDAWLGFLDNSGGHGQFSRGPGRLLASGPYQRAMPASTDMQQLNKLVRQWVQHNCRNKHEH